MRLVRLPSVKISLSFPDDAVSESFSSRVHQFLQTQDPPVYLGGTLLQVISHCQQIWMSKLMVKVTDEVYHKVALEVSQTEHQSECL